MKTKTNYLMLAGLMAAQMAAGAGNELNDERNGFRVSVPTGWTAQQNQLGYALTSTTHEGALLVMPHRIGNLEEARKLAAEGFLVKGTVELLPAGPVRVSGAGKLAVDLAGTWAGKAARGRLVLAMSPYGGGVMVLAGAHSGAYTEEFAALADAVLGSAEYRKQDASGAVGEWSTRLRGKKLHFFNTYNSEGMSGGMAQHKQIGLCSDGSFFFRGDFSASINVPGATANSGNRNSNIGQWQVQAAGQNAALVLTFANGAQASYVLGADAGKTFLNGKRWLMEPATECR